MKATILKALFIAPFPLWLKVWTVAFGGAALWVSL
jgi:hypothetical protein